MGIKHRKTEIWDIDYRHRNMNAAFICAIYFLAVDWVIRGGYHILGVVRGEVNSYLGFQDLALGAWAIEYRGGL